MSVQGRDGGLRSSWACRAERTFFITTMEMELSADVSESAGILKANGTLAWEFLTGDLDNDGWPDIYVANDSTASALYQNKKNGKFVDIALEAGCALSPDGKPQAGMGFPPPIMIRWQPGHG